MLDRLKKEIRDIVKSPEDLIMEKVGELKWMNACIEEGLRIFPPIPIGLLRTVPKRGSDIDGHFVPAGTSVCVSSWVASHNPANFVSPDAFIPERWTSSKYDSDIKKTSQPFSLGPRGCIGRNLTYVELRLILAALLDVEFADGALLWSPVNEYAGLRALNTWEKSSLMITLTDIRK